jgi:hypothetical protein
MSNKHAYPSNPAQYKQIYTSWLSPSFKSGDYAITLTFPEHTQHFDEWSQASYDLHRKHVHNYLNDVNSAFLGTTWKSGKHRLKCAYVFEEFENQGVTVHLILQAPNDKRIAQDKHEMLLRLLGTEMQLSEKIKAITVKKINIVNNWLGLMFRDLRKTDVITAHFSEKDWHLNAS